MQYIIELRPKIRQLLDEKNYTLKEVFDLISAHGVDISFNTFKGYVYKKRPMNDADDHPLKKMLPFVGQRRSGTSDVSERHDEDFADSIASP